MARGRARIEWQRKKGADASAECLNRGEIAEREQKAEMIDASETACICQERDLVFLSFFFFIDDARSSSRFCSLLRFSQIYSSFDRMQIISNDSLSSEIVDVKHFFNFYVVTLT